jgi:hypothetical protein
MEKTNFEGFIFLLSFAFLLITGCDSCKEMQVTQCSFSKEQIIKLADFKIPSTCVGCKLVGAVFRIDSQQTESIQAFSVIFIPKSVGDKPNEGDIDILIDPVKFATSGFDLTDIKTLPVENTIPGKNLDTAKTLPCEFNKTTKFELVFFKSEDLLRLANFTFSDSNHIKSNGIRFLRIVDHKVPNDIGFQSLKAFTNPAHFEVSGVLTEDVVNSEVYGAPCPPKWNNEPTSTTLGVQYSNIVKLSDNREVNLTFLYEKFLKKIKPLLH